MLTGICRLYGAPDGNSILMVQVCTDGVAASRITENSAG